MSKYIMEIYPIKKRVKIREMLKKHKELTEKQIEKLTSPLKMRLKAIDKTLKNSMPVEQYKEISNKTSKWYDGLLKCNKCKGLRKKIRMLEKLEDVANVGEWDLDTIYKEILEGCDYGIKINPDPEFAQWFAKRYNLKVEE